MYQENSGDEPIIPVKVCYYSKSGVIGESMFTSDDTFISVLNYFENNLKVKGRTKLKSSYSLNGRNIQPNDKLFCLINTDDISKFSEIDFSLEIDEYINLDDEQSPEMEKILQPKVKPFGLFIYIPKEAIISLEHYPTKIAKRYELDKINETSANCNSPTNLYISGGKSFNQEYIDFWIISQANHSIIKKDMLFGKSNHSMIYISLPTLECIFIAGGDELKTLLFDIKNNYFLQWGEMNEKHIKPALFRCGEYLYCFNSFSKNINYFERTYLSGPEHNWEKIFPNYKNNGDSNFNMQYYGVSSSTDGNVLIVGGNNAQEHAYIYDPSTNLLFSCDNSKNESIRLNDKTFYKVDKYHNVALPSTLANKKEIAIINKCKKSLRKINFGTSEGRGRIKLSAIDKEHPDEENGIIMVKAKFKQSLKKDPSKDSFSKREQESKQNQQKVYERPKNLEQQLKFSENPIKIETQQEFVFDAPQIEEEKIPIQRVKIEKPKENLYISNILFDEQMISRKIENKELEQKEEKNFGKNENNYNIKKIDQLPFLGQSREENKSENDKPILYDIKRNGKEEEIKNDNLINLNENSNENNAYQKKKLQDKFNKANNLDGDEQNFGEINQITEKDECFEESKKNFGNNVEEFQSEGIIGNQGRVNYKEDGEEQKYIEENNYNEEGEKNIIYIQKPLERQEYNEEKEEKKYGEKQEIFGQENNKYGQNKNEMENFGEEEQQNFEEDNEQEEDGLQKRDFFKETITQAIGEDIIQIEEYPICFYDEENFCDYKAK